MIRQPNPGWETNSYAVSALERHTVPGHYEPTEVLGRYRPVVIVFVGHLALEMKGLFALVDEKSLSALLAIAAGIAFATPSAAASVAAGADGFASASAVAAAAARGARDGQNTQNLEPSRLAANLK